MLNIIAQQKKQYFVPKFLEYKTKLSAAGHFVPFTHLFTFALGSFHSENKLILIFFDILLIVYDGKYGFITSLNIHMQVMVLRYSGFDLIFHKGQWN